MGRASAPGRVTPRSEPARVGGSWTASRRRSAALLRFLGLFCFFPIKIGLLLCRTLVLGVMSADVVDGGGAGRRRRRVLRIETTRGGKRIRDDDDDDGDRKWRSDH